MLVQTAKILVVDDMPTLRELVKRQLKDLGYRNIIEAGDGEEALQLLQAAESSGQKVEFVVCDWNMPKLTGIDFLRQVRAQTYWDKLPFILLTSESERDHVTEAILAGVSQYIVKPFTAKAFEEKFKSAWGKHNSGK